MKRIGCSRTVLLGGVALLAVVGVVTVIVLIVRPLGRGSPNLNEVTLVAVSQPQDDTVVALHHEHTIVAEGYAAVGIAELQLWINDQQWGTLSVAPVRDHVTHTWAWVPSGEGEHHLVARAIDSNGAVTESSVVRVFASRSLDVLFPQSYTALTGDRVDTLATRMDSTVGGILESNPGLNPNAPIPPGTQLTIPVPLPFPPSQTEGGEPAAPPAGNPLLPPGSSVEEVAVNYQGGAHVLPGGAFSLIDGILRPNEPADLLYLYLSVNGKEWGRIPEEPDQYLQPQGGNFDLTSYLKSVAAKVGTEPVQIQAEVWAWRQGALVFLGYYIGEITTDAGGLQTTGTGATQLRLIDYVYLGKEHYKQGVVLTGDDPDLDEAFRWTTSLPGVTYAIWQVADKGFPPGSVLNPPGLVHQGVSHGDGGKFTLNFDSYFSGGGGSGGFGGFGGLGGFKIPNSADDLLGLTQDPEKQFAPWLPKAFFIRVIPMTGVAGLTQEVAGPPSQPMVILYTPSGSPYSPKAPPAGPVYEARVVGFDSYREADSDYGACMVTNYELRDCRNVFGYSDSGNFGYNPWTSVSMANVQNGQLTLAQYYQCQITVPTGTQSCGCPGVSCSSSSDSCGDLSLGGVGDCLQKGAEAFGSAVGSLASLGASLYNGAVDFVTDALSSVACGALSGEAKKVCEAGVGIAVKVGLTSLGLPPEVPDFEKLMNEGLDYALAVAAEQISAQLGFECDKFCQDLIKAGIEGVNDPENLMDNGLAFAASHAAGELKDLGLNCDAKCQGLIQQAAEGDLQVSVALNAALDQAAAEAAAQLNANGYPCDAVCQEKIRSSMENARDLIVSSANAAASKPPPPLMLPHPLAVAQPAVVTVEVFRRWESAGIPQQDLDHCGLTVFTSETTSLGGTSFGFSPFLGKGLELPNLEPGETIRIPVALDRKFTDITPAMVDSALSDLQAAGIIVAGAVTQDGKPVGTETESGVVSGGVLTAWFELYHGGTLQVKLSGPPFMTVSGAIGQVLPCVADETWTTGISDQ